MPSLKDLRIRINSVKSTRKITSAMKMVAASKLRRAQVAAEEARPFAERMERMLAALMASLPTLDGAPPLLILVGDAEVLLDDSRKLADVAKAAGVEVTLSVYPEMPHIWTMSYPAFPEAVEGVTEMAEFVARVTA